MSYINHNPMARNVANNLKDHYARLETSVQRLSAGLRINSAADDAAGLAIRELMRTDAAALHQGVRNANDAISLLQVADGALAIIDEKLIRMKELAEQAATGTYNSIQRMVIDSEYQAMASEIDRIARATDFNGIKLLDGSLGGEHDGRGLKSTGKMKIHFGSGNDSAEDYYYVDIGDCTAGALGVGLNATQSGQQVTYTKVETQKEVTASFTHKAIYEEYHYGNSVYYKGDNFYFSNLSDPYGSRLDETRHQHIIENLTRNQNESQTTIYYTKTFIDPDTNIEYYHSDFTYTSDPYDPVGKGLDRNNPDHDAIFQRLQESPTQKTITVTLNWKEWINEAGVKYYSYNNGQTMVPVRSHPTSNALDRNDPDDAVIMDSLDIVYGTKTVSLPLVGVTYMEWLDPQTQKVYYSADGGKTFVSDAYKPSTSLLDSDKDKYIINRLVKNVAYTTTGRLHNTYTDTNGIKWYTRDHNIWYINPNDPSKGILDINSAQDSVIIATLQPVEDHERIRTICAIYEDTANGNKRYYSKDNGKTFFSDLADPLGSEFSASDPKYSSLIANFNKVNSTTQITETFTTYWDKVTGTKYYTRDGGKLYYTNPMDSSSLLDPSDAANKIIIANLELYPEDVYFNFNFYRYRDPLTGKVYYSLDHNKNIFRDQAFIDASPVLNSANSADIDIINRLEADQQTKYASLSADKFPTCDVYRDENTNIYYYSVDGGQTFNKSAQSPYTDMWQLDPDDPADKAIIDALKPYKEIQTTIEYIKNVTDGGVIPGDGASISTQESAQKALAAIGRAIVSKDKIRAHLGALQNRLENTVANLTIQGEALQAAESRISDADIAAEMTNFVRNQILTQSAVAMLGQANSYPHMLLTLLNG